MLTGRLDEANIYLSKLSRLLRMVLVHSDDENITLSKELEMLSLYLELESLRFKGSFLYNIDVDEEIVTEDILVPALILQPFAENAIWHGLLKNHDNRQLNICIRLKQEMLQCIIRDNGIGRAKAASLKSKHSKNDSRGVKLIEKRIKILKDQLQEPDTAIHITDLYDLNNEPEGTKVEIILPIITL
jgi:LytS/YehU family sensor histidine kinase